MKKLTLLILLSLAAQLQAGAVLEKSKKIYITEVEDKGDSVSIKIDIGKFTKLKSQLFWFSDNPKVTNAYYAGRLCEKDDQIPYALLFYKYEIKNKGKFSSKARKRYDLLTADSRKAAAERSLARAEEERQKAEKEKAALKEKREKQRLIAEANDAKAQAEKMAGKWLTDSEQAFKIAKALNKPVLINYTGSNWCGYCIKLHREVFSTNEFKNWAKKNVVLLEADFPRPNNLPQKQQAQNKELMKEFGPISGYPTVLLISKKRKKLFKYGYKAGGPEAWTKIVGKYIK